MEFTTEKHEISTTIPAPAKVEVETEYLDALIRCSAQVDSLISVLSLPTGKYIEKELIFAILGMECPEDASKHRDE